MKEGQVSRNSPENRVSTRFSHFKNLLGNPHNVEDPDEEIPNITENPNTNVYPFTIDEYRKIKASLKTGRVADPDNILYLLTH